MTKVKCVECGKEFTLSEKQQFLLKFPNKIKCPSCAFGTGNSKAAAPAKKPEPEKAKEPDKFKCEVGVEGKQKICAEAFLRAYEELRAVFAGREDEVKDYMGGWTSTIVITRSK